MDPGEQVGTGATQGFGVDDFLSKAFPRFIGPHYGEAIVANVDWANPPRRYAEVDKDSAANRALALRRGMDNATRTRVLMSGKRIADGPSDPCRGESAVNA